ncbi:MAG: hypothetical protein M0Z99_06405 [Betaproteobacteria bacterium]|nr:hypothetical protein [Betaproteobacteria bacterium]
MRATPIQIWMARGCETPWNSTCGNMTGLSSKRGGYLLDLLCYFAPQHEEWQHSLLPWLDDVANQLPEVPLLPFFPKDSRHNPMDALAARWRLSSGALYDRLKRLLRPPYVC